jgi:23S rRNA (cytosine1962-C5)-methyltransferase
MTASVTISARGEARINAGHPWVYRSDLVGAEATGGDIVAVRSARGRRLGLAFYSSESKIAIRMVARGEETNGLGVIRRRIHEAIRFRQSLGIDGNAYRLVHAEGDLLPSLVVDQYGEYLVVQALSQTTDRLLPEIVAMLREQLRPRGILARNDPAARTLEGLERRVEVVDGEVPDSISIRELGIDYEVNLRQGQKTGLFLDQRENRAAAACYAHGRLLDCFSYNGGFALALARRCVETIAYDISEDAVARLSANAARNAIVVDARVGNVFDELRALERRGEQFDTIVLDPPAFAKTKAAVAKATSGYKEINLRALRLLTAGGILVTSSCSYHVPEALFAEIVYDAAADARVDLSVVEKRMQGRDHPVLLSVPETYYLKCLILRKLA